MIPQPAPEGRHNLAQGVNPGVTSHPFLLTFPAPEGRHNLAQGVNPGVTSHPFLPTSPAPEGLHNLAQGVSPGVTSHPFLLTSPAPEGRHPTPLKTLTLLLCFILPTLLTGAYALVNPSFEITGSAGIVFRGWEQFGGVGTSSTAVHGSKAALIMGQTTGSGLWQQLQCNPGEQWTTSGHVMVPSAYPLTGSSQAFVKVEWFNSSGSLINFETHPVADASTPSGQYQGFTNLSSPAPAGTTAMRIVLVVLQGASEPACQAVFDQITCYSTASPTIDEVQWGDFPGGRTLEFSNRLWRVKGPGFYGPGPNNFSDSEQSVWVDAQDRLHVTIRQISGAWNSTEVTLIDTLGYGDYIFTTSGPLQQLHDRAVLGLFLWQYNTNWDPADSWWNPYNEFDIEYSRWGSPGNQLGQFVAQPWDWDGNIFRYGASFGASEISSHAFRWLPDRVECRAWRGGPADEATSIPITSWTYTGPHIPRPEQPRVHINLWYFGDPPTSTQEVVLTRFTHVPPGGVVDSADELSILPPSSLLPNFPNPFNPSTLLRFNLATPTTARLEVYDLRGRKIATLAYGYYSAGPHQIQWNATGLPSGVYIYRLTTPSGSESRRCLLMK